MKEENTRILQKSLGQLFAKSLQISMPIEMLHLIREKINASAYQSFHKEEILDEMGKLQRTCRELNSEMLHIYELLQKEG